MKCFIRYLVGKNKKTKALEDRNIENILPAGLFMADRSIAERANGNEGLA